MRRKSKLLYIFSGIFICSLVFILGFNRKSYTEYPTSLYQVYLNGNPIGVLQDEQILYDLIDTEQQNLKSKYNVDKIYPPNGLEVSEIYTYDGDINDPVYIYDIIKNDQPFTIKGYEVTIQYQNSGDEEEEKKDPLSIYLLNKEDLETAIKNVVTAFVGEENLDAYLNSAQGELKDEGTIIDDVRLKEDITIKDAYISTEKTIFTNADDLSKFLLFGTTEKQKTYICKSGDTVNSVANANNLNVDELLVANDNLKSKNSLLFPNQELNIGLINPLISVVVEQTKAEYTDVNLDTIVKYNKNLTIGTSYIEVEPVTGKSRLTYKTETVNGEITQAVKISSEEITPAVAKVIVKGGLEVNYVGDSSYWAWPTLSGYCITSLREWRWGSWHNGIDISCTGHGSPIFAIQDGTVVAAGYSGSMGNYVYVDHHNNYISVYMHLSKIYVSKGQNVSKGTTIGAMGSTGRSTGTHLHFTVVVDGYPYQGGKDIDPFLLYK